jgi:hypothetical protein
MRTHSNRGVSMSGLGAKIVRYQRAVAILGTRLSRALAQRRGWLMHPLRPGWRRKAVIATGLVVCCAGIPLGALWWRLGSGPLSVDFATPWLTSAIEERFGGAHKIEVGGTQLERTEEGRAALRLRDIVVRDPDGVIVASAPKAEVGLSGAGLFTGHLQAKRLSLIGAAMSVRIEQDGAVTIFAGADTRPIASAPGSGKAGTAAGDRIPLVPDRAGVSAPPSWSSAASGDQPASAPAAASAEGLSAMVGWLERLDVLGLDGGELSEIGLKSGNVSVDDARTGKRWTFGDINFSLRRPKEGGVALAVRSTGADGPWSLTATISPRGNGRRAIEAVLRDLSPKDLMLGLRVADANFEANMPISALVRGEIGPDGVPENVEGRIVIGAGYLGSPNDQEDRIVIDGAHIDLRWDAAKRAIIVPVEISSGPNRISLSGEIDAPRQGVWQFAFNRGQIMLAGVDRVREAPLMLDHVSLTGRLDAPKRRLELDHGDLSGAAAGLAFSGALDFSGPDARLIAGLAATHMSASSLKRIWPVFVQTKVRKWAIDHVLGGSVERLIIATNAPLSTLRAGGPPVPDDGISIELVGSAVQLQPIMTLPVIHDADLTMRVVGRHVTVTIGRGVGALASGRKLAVANIAFEVADTFPKEPPSRLRFRIDGGVDGVAELISLDPLREACGLQFDPATSRGTMAANVTLTMPISPQITQDKLSFGIEADFANFAAERLVHNQKVEAAALHVSASQQGILVRGDARIGGSTPAAIEYRVPIGGGDADLRAQATLDDSTRGRLGLDLNGALSGPIPLKIVGRLGAGDHESRFNVEADLTAAKIIEVLPGWNKLAGKPARASFAILERARGLRFEDIVLEGPGTLVKGTVEIDKDGEIASANFSNFALSDGDKASLKAERAPEGALKVTLRGDVYDGRGFVRGVMSNTAHVEKPKPARDLELDVKVGALAGFNGEALRSVDLRVARRAGQIRNFALSAKLGRDATLLGDWRAPSNGRHVIYLETNDAGALARFTDTYPKIIGGHLWVTMDPPSAEPTPQQGMLNVRQFTVRGEPALERIASSGGEPTGFGGAHGRGGMAGTSFTHLHFEFTRSPGKLGIKDGVVFGDAIGATLEGLLDYTQDRVRMRGMFVPLYGLNNLFVRLPLVGPILGGENEGLLGVTFEVVGTPHSPELRINPMSTLALGPLRKLFEFRGSDATNSIPSQLPSRE